MTTSPTPTTNRTRRFRREPDSVAPITRWNERDDAILEALALHRFATSDDLHRIVGGSKQGLSRRLQQLYHHSYLDRPPKQLALWNHGSRSMIYALGDEGAKLLRARGIEIAGDARSHYWHRKNLQVSSAHIHHTTTISSFYSALKTACDAHGVELAWTPEGDALRDKILLPGSRKRGNINPDGFAHLRWQIPGKRRNRWAFIEIDTGTEPNSRETVYGTDIETKMRSFWEWGFIQKRHQAKFSIPGFLVLFATTAGTRRIENILATARRIDPKKRGASMFWAGHFTSATNPADLLKDAWKTPNGQTHSLLE
jgi:hypothetical protein